MMIAPSSSSSPLHSKSFTPEGSEICSKERRFGDILRDLIEEETVVERSSIGPQL
ncbi:MAG: hypothetical protein AAF585_23940 [Verrucomicrobiota bacterium]